MCCISSEISVYAYNFLEAILAFSLRDLLSLPSSDGYFHQLFSDRQAQQNL